MQERTVPPAPAGAGARPRVAATLVLASIGAFVTSLDIVVVSTALPSLRVHLAAGFNNTMREAGGLFGVAVLAAVFSANGSYLSRAAFLHGVRFAILVAAAVALAAMIPALLGASRAQALADTPVPDADAPGPPEPERERAAVPR